MTTPDEPASLWRIAPLAAAVFVTSCCEFLPGGLIPQISHEFERSIPEVGLLVTGFALAVVLSTTPLAAATRRFAMKALLIVAFAVIVLANFLTAWAPSFESLVGARIIGGLAHGLFWSTVFAYCAQLYAADRLPRATTTVALGGSVAGILGVPLGNALGQFFSWRIAFGTFAVVGLLLILVIALTLPAVPRGPRPAGERRRRPDRSIGAVAAICVVIVFAVVSQVSFGTYFAVWLENVAGLPGHFLPVVMLLTGVAGAAGVAVVGPRTGRRPLRVFTVAALVITGAMVTLAALGGSAPVGVIVAIVAMSSAAFAGIPILLQTSVLRVAAVSVRDLASSLQTTAFNVGIGGGALVGGLVVQFGGIRAVPIGAAVIFAITLALGWAFAWNLRGRDSLRASTTEVG